MANFLLHEKVLEADLKAVNGLIDQKVDLDELDDLGHTALHWAVFGGYYEIVKVLLEAGANPNVYSKDGVTPKWRARDFGLIEIETLLTTYGGIISTNEQMDITSFRIFGEIINKPLPENEG